MDKNPPFDEIRHFKFGIHTLHVKTVQWQGDVSSPDYAPTPDALHTINSRRVVLKLLRWIIRVHSGPCLFFLPLLRSKLSFNLGLAYHFQTVQAVGQG